MAKKRSSALTDKIASSSQNRASWEEQFSDSAPTEPLKPEPAEEEFKRATYILTPQLINRLKAQAAEHNVQLNELVRFILDEALTQLEAGQLTLEFTDEVIIQRRLANQ